MFCRAGESGCGKQPDWHDGYLYTECRSEWYYGLVWLVSMGLAGWVEQVTQNFIFCSETQKKDRLYDLLRYQTGHCGII